MPDSTFSVWHDNLTEPYRVKMNPAICNCPHWIHRLKQVGRRCKHHRLVEEKQKLGGIL